MNKRNTIIIANALAIALVAPLAAWDTEGHHLITEQAVSLLPEPLKSLFMKHKAYLIAHDLDPDRWKLSMSWEQPHHFIDLDNLDKPPFSEIPRDYDKAVEKYGKDKLDKNGTVPWVIERRYGDLVRAWRGLARRPSDQPLFESAILAHYVEDAHVPFHANANYDGQLTGQKGIHERFEGEIVRRFINLPSLKPLPLEPKYDKVHLAAFGWSFESFAFTEALLKADLAAKEKAKDYNDAYYAEFRKVAEPIAVKRLEQGAQRLASLWWQAYEEAGQPDLSRIVSD